MNRTTRVVVELSGDISSAMPRMKRLIKGCAYNPDAHLLAFRHKDMRLVVEPRRVIINGVKDEATARTVMDWLRGILNVGGCR